MALLVTAQHGQTQSYELIIEGGASVLARSNTNQSALHLVACQTDSVELLEIIILATIKAGLSVEIVDKEGYSPLMRAIANARLTSTVYLIKKGTGLAHKTNFGTGLHAIHYAAAEGPIVLACLLDNLDRKYNYLLEEPGGSGEYTPIGLALKLKQFESDRLLKAKIKSNSSSEDGIATCKLCDGCGAEERGSLKLKVCVCRGRRYCAQACVQASWAKHKGECKIWRALTKVQALEFSKGKEEQLSRSKEEQLSRVEEERLSILKKEEQLVRAKEDQFIRLKGGDDEVRSEVNSEVLALDFAVETCDGCGACEEASEKRIKLCVCKWKQFCVDEERCSLICSEFGLQHWRELHKADCEKWRKEIEAEVEEEENMEEEEEEEEDGNEPCSQCGNTDAGVEKFFCAACEQTQYCGRVCQRAHWKSGHKQDCKAWIEEKEKRK